MTAILLRLLPFKWWIVGAAVVSIFVYIGALKVDVWRAENALAESMSIRAQEREDLSSAIALRAQEREAAADAARELSEEYRLEDQRRASAIRSVVSEAIKTSEAVALDANSVRAAHDRLLHRYRAALAASRRPSGDSSAPTGSPATAGADDLSTELLGRVSEAAGRLALIADERGIAGHACEASYDALTGNPRN
jgi:hypothetical protein